MDKCGKLLKDIETKTEKDKKGQVKHGKDAEALWLKEAKGRRGGMKRSKEQKEQKQKRQLEAMVMEDKEDENAV